MERIAGYNTKYSLEEFIICANKVHNNKYSYEKVSFNTLKDKVIIICPIHGEFLQSADKHLRRKQGCPSCTKTKKLNTETFIEKAKKVHNNFYSYEKVNYVNSKTNVIITCPEHGYFEQAPSCHLIGQGCPSCFENRRFLSTEEFIEKAKRVHGNKYSYAKTIYTGNYNKVIITCPLHGDFEQTPNAHIHAQQGCTTCGYIKNGQKSQLKEEDILKEFGTLPNTKNLKFLKYFRKNNKAYVTVKCLICGRESSLAWGSIRFGTGCICTSRNLTENKIREVLENMTGLSFPRIRPSFLGKQHLDGYNEETKIAFEYNGFQHFDKNSNWYSEKMVTLDKIKREKCEKEGVTLIDINDNEINNFSSAKEIEEVLKEKLITFGYTGFLKSIDENYRFTFDSLLYTSYEQCKEALEELRSKGYEIPNTQKAYSAWVTKNKETFTKKFPAYPTATYQNFPGYGVFLDTGRKRNSIDIWIEKAKELCKENNGLLPSYTRLSNRGYSGLASQYRQHPEKFVGIEQEKVNKSPEEWLEVAIKLASKNDGMIPNSFWLLKKGYNGLNCCIKSYPEYFKNLKQEVLEVRKKVYCEETQKTYNSLTEASKELNLDLSKISAVCLGKRNHTGGYHFSFVPD